MPDIPLAGAVTSIFPAGSDWSILRLDQKVVLLGHNCVIAWAGNVAFARAVITEFQALASQAPLSMPVIQTYLASLDPTMKDQVSFVGWVRDGEVFHQFWYRADIAQSAMFGRVSAGGSAATDFVMLASQISGGSWNEPGRALSDLERAIPSMLSATSLLLRAELSSENNLLQYFGGGCEIATFVGDQFAKLGDIAFVFWMATVTDGEVALSGPWLILKQDYADDFLLLHELRMRPGDVSTDPPLIEEHRHVVAPFGSTVDATRANSISWPGMEATFSIKDEGDDAVIATFVGCTVRLRFAYDRPNQTGLLIAEKIEGSDRDPLTLFDFGFGPDGVALDVEPRHGAEVSMSSKTDAAEIVLHALDLALDMAPK